MASPKASPTLNPNPVLAMTVPCKLTVTDAEKAGALSNFRRITKINNLNLIDHLQSGDWNQGNRPAFLKVVVRLKGDRPCAGEKRYEIPARTIPLSL